jgi:hypothetical protein
MDMNEAYIKTVNAITGWKYSQRLENALAGVDFDTLDENKIPESNPEIGEYHWYKFSDIEFEINTRDGDFVELLVRMMDDNQDDINWNQKNIFWYFDDDMNTIFAIFADTEDEAIEKFEKKVNSYK